MRTAVTVGLAACPYIVIANEGFVGLEAAGSIFDYEIPNGENIDTLLNKAKEWCDTFFP